MQFKTRTIAPMLRNEPSVWRVLLPGIVGWLAAWALILAGIRYIVWPWIAAILRANGVKGV